MWAHTYIVRNIIVLLLFIIVLYHRRHNYLIGRSRSNNASWRPVVCVYELSTYYYYYCTPRALSNDGIPAVVIYTRNDRVLVVYKKKKVFMFVYHRPFGVVINYKKKITKKSYFYHHHCENIRITILIIIINLSLYGCRHAIFYVSVLRQYLQYYNNMCVIYGPQYNSIFIQFKTLKRRST